MIIWFRTVALALQEIAIFNISQKSGLEIVN